MKWLEIDGELFQVHHTGPADRYGFVPVYVAQQRRPSQCHSLPREWVEGNTRSTVRTGGHTYRKAYQGDTA